MLMQDSKTAISSYEEYLAIYFPGRTVAAVTLTTSPREMGIQLAVESLERHGETLHHIREEATPTEQGG